MRVAFPPSRPLSFHIRVDRCEHGRNIEREPLWRDNIARDDPDTGTIRTPRSARSKSAAAAVA